MPLKNRKCGHRSLVLRARGFTLIELMIVVGIVAILAAVAYPSYTTYVQKGRRTDAKNALLDLASREEKYFATNGVYTADLSSTGLGIGGTQAGTANVQSSSGTFYTLTVTLQNNGFSATAAPLQGTAQATDACGNYTLTNLGVQTNSTNATGCW